MNEQYNDSSYSFLPSCDGWCAVLCWSIIMVPISIWLLQSSLCQIQSDQRTSWVEKAGCGQQQKRQHPVRGGGLSTREVNLTPELVVIILLSDFMEQSYAIAINWSMGIRYRARIDCIHQFPKFCIMMTVVTIIVFDANTCVNHRLKLSILDT